MKVKDIGKYAYGYEIFALMDGKKKQKPKVKGDRYHTKSYGQALRYAQYAVVAVCANRGMSSKKTEADALESVLAQWITFETWVEKLPSNSAYKSGGSFDWVNYYKGSTINADLQQHQFLP